MEELDIVTVHANVIMATPWKAKDYNFSVFDFEYKIVSVFLKSQQFQSCKVAITTDCGNTICSGKATT